jgi:hypothetical protein
MGEILTLEHDPEKWESVFGQDHTQQRTIPIRLLCRIGPYFSGL